MPINGIYFPRIPNYLISIGSPGATIRPFDDASQKKYRILASPIGFWCIDHHFGLGLYTNEFPFSVSAFSEGMLIGKIDFYGLIFQGLNALLRIEEGTIKEFGIGGIATPFAVGIVDVIIGNELYRSAAGTYRINIII